jgi:hypothetical protein
MATFQLNWWRETSGALPCIISGTNGHLIKYFKGAIKSILDKE